MLRITGAEFIRSEKERTMESLNALDTGSRKPLREEMGYCLAFPSGDLPAGVRREARRALLDTLGCVLLGAGERFPQAGGLATGAAGELKAPAFTAGGVREVALKAAIRHNAGMAQVHDANDGHTVAAARKGPGHPGRTIVPAALATAAATGAKRADLEAAIIAGYEFGCRVIPRHQPMNLEALGAVVAMGRLRALPPDLVLTACGLALPLSPQILPLGWSADWHHNFLRCGAAAAAAFDALEAARHGMRGPDPAQPEASRILALDEASERKRWMIEGRYTKPFPSCRMTHGAVECALALRARDGFDPARIRRIEAAVVPGAMYVAGTALRPGFKSRSFSLPVCVALALYRGRLTPEDLSGPIEDEIADLAKHVSVVEDTAFAELYPEKGRPARLTIEFTDGKTESPRIDVPLGEPGRPESDSGLLDRFRNYGKSVYPAPVLDRVGEWILSAPEDEPVASLAALLREAPPPARNGHSAERPEVT